jgi:predicted nucleotidyltransferase
MRKKEEILAPSELYVLAKQAKNLVKAQDIYVGGSYGEGIENKDSDIDLYVVMPREEFDDKYLNVMPQVKRYLHSLYSKKVDFHWVAEEDLRSMALIHYEELSNKQLLRKPIRCAIIGTTCSGKTTLTLKLSGALKEMGVNVECISGSDRRLSFPRWKIERRLEAQLWFILRQAVLELEGCLQVGADIVISDRSPIDFSAYLLEMYPEESVPFLRDFLRWWYNTYNALVIAHPYPYQDDKNRPGDDFRLRVHKILLELISDIRTDDGTRSWSSTSILLQQTPAIFDMETNSFEHILDYLYQKVRQADADIIEQEE